MSDELLIHIGYHKTASTWLQRGLFGPHSKCFAEALPLGETIDTFVRPRALAWRHGAAALRLAAGVERARASGRVPVVSCEELSGNPHAGGRDAAEIARRLAKVAPAARILVVVRRQPDAIASAYRQFVRRGGVLSPRAYLGADPAWFRMARPDPAHWDYAPLVDHYRALFGGSRVKVLAYESLIADGAGFLAEITRFAGCGEAAVPSPSIENRASSAAATAILRWTNRLCMRDDVNPAAPFRWWRVGRSVEALDRWFLHWFAAPFERRLAREVAAYCEGRYEAGNDRLARTSGLDLASLGYRTADSRSSASSAR